MGRFSASLPPLLPARLWTVGHSTRSADELRDLLLAEGIEQVADVRLFPMSRRHPQFGGEAMESWLAAAGIGYRHFPELGGRRRPRPDSPHTAWRNEAFRGYADHMETAEFARGAAALAEWARAARTALLCAEAVWWQCHRSLLADLFQSRGVEVLHLVGPGKVQPHPYTGAARLRQGELTYEADQGELPLP